MEVQVPHVYRAIENIHKSVAATGIGKTGSGNNSGRSIDDIIDIISPLLVSNRLCILPRAVSCQREEHRNKDNKSLFHVVIHCEYDFVSVIDGSRHLCSAFGEAMDVGDKATTKAMSVCYKNMAIQAFNIPINPNQNLQNELLIDSICREIGIITEPVDFIDYVKNEMPKKSIKVPYIANRIWHFIKEHGDMLGLMYISESQTWINKTIAEGMGESIAPNVTH